MSMFDHEKVVRGIAKVKASLETARSQSREATDNVHVQEEISSILEMVRKTQKRIHKLCFCPACGLPLTWDRECTYKKCTDEH